MTKKPKKSRLLNSRLLKFERTGVTLTPTSKAASSNYCFAHEPVSVISNIAVDDNQSCMSAPATCFDASLSLAGISPDADVRGDHDKGVSSSTSAPRQSEPDSDFMSNSMQ